MSRSSPPEADPQLERVEVSCDSWDQFERLFRRRLDSHQVFVPSVQPPPVGAQLEFLFSIPDGTSITMPGRVVSTFPPSGPREPSSAERAGMIVEFGKFARAEEERVRALLASLEEQDRLSGMGPDSLPAIPPPRAPSTPSRSPTTPPRVQTLPPLITWRPARHDAGAAPRSQRAVRFEDDVAVSEAVRMMELHQYPEAIRLLIAVLDLDPDKRSARLWLNLAGARHARELGELQIAADCYRAVLELQADHPEAAAQLALLPPARSSAQQLGPQSSLLARLLGRRNGSDR